MGLITSVNDITKAIESEKKQKQREKQQKELEKIRQTKIRRELEQYFEKQYKKSINYDETTYKLIKNKMLIIDIIKDGYVKKHKIKSLDFNTKVFLNDEYIKILNKTKKPYLELKRIEEKEQKEILKQQKEAEKIQKQIEKQNKNKLNPTAKTIEIIVIILLLPLAIIIGLVKGFFTR